MKVEHVLIENIKVRPGNPNYMSPKQMNALKRSIATYGELQPIILDQDNNLIDGHQRRNAYLELGKLEIPAIKLDLEKESDKLLLSQLMNKIRGSHDKELDAADFKSILEEKDLSELSDYLAQSELEIQNIINKVDKEKEEINVKKTEQLGVMLITCPHCNGQFKKGDSK